MKRSSLLILASLTISLTGCFNERIRPSGVITSEEYILVGYTQLEVSSAFEAFVTFTDTDEKVEIIADDNIMDYIRVTNTGTKLIIKIAQGYNVTGKPTLRAKISTASLSRIEASGATNIFLENTLDSESLKIKLSGASIFTGDLSLTNVEMEISGASEIDVVGSASNFELDISGASKAGNYSFVTEYLDANISGASEVRMSVIDEIDVNISGGSRLNYKGTASVDSKDISGASSVNNRN